MSIPRTAGMIDVYSALPQPLQEYFVHFPKLVEDFPHEVALSYLFAQIELAHNMTIYCGVVKCHCVNADVARNSVNAHHMTRERFRDLYRLIMDNKRIEAGALEKAISAEKVRDKILHGKKVQPADKREAIVNSLEYATQFNEQVFRDAGFRPFGRLSGFKGRAKALDKSTSRWVLMGIGLISPKKTRAEVGHTGDEA